jgi:hypothetical protein
LLYLLQYQRIHQTIFPCHWTPSSGVGDKERSAVSHVRPHCESVRRPPII